LIPVSATPSSGSCALATPVICDLGTLANGGSITVTVVASTTVTGTAVSTASVTADQIDVATTNNTDTEKTSVTLPNLIISALNTATAVLPGGDLVISDTTKNNGSVSAGSSTTKFFLSTDNKLDAGDVLLGSRTLAGLPSKQASTGSITVTIPPGTALGKYFLIAVADADNAVAETNNNNNKKSRNLSVTRSDLTVSRLQSPASAAAGSAITISDTTSNKTTVSAESSTTNYYLSTDPILDGSDILLTGRAVPALPPKSSSSGSSAAVIPLSTVPGKYYLIAASDNGGAVVEVNESNNTRSRKVTITP
jgi:subtilase family serine protease